MNRLETAVPVHRETALTVRVSKQGNLQSHLVENRVCFAGAEDVIVFVLGRAVRKLEALLEKRPLGQGTKKRRVLSG